MRGIPTGSARPSTISDISPINNDFKKVYFYSPRGMYGHTHFPESMIPQNIF